MGSTNCGIIGQTIHFVPANISSLHIVNRQHTCHQMAYFEAKMHHIRFRLPRLPCCISKGRKLEGEEERKMRERKGERKGEEREGGACPTNKNCSCSAVSWCLFCACLKVVGLRFGRNDVRERMSDEGRILSTPG